VVPLEHLQRGLLARRVAVEGEDHLTVQPVVGAEEALEHAGVVVAEGGAAAGHGGVDPGQVGGHHVGVALDHHSLRAFPDGPAGQVQAVEHVGFLVDGGFGSVDVLGGQPVVVEDPAAAETQH